MRKHIPLILGLLLLAVPARAQDAHETDAEREVSALLAAFPIVVVHFWAPWCDNSVTELRSGWYEVVEDTAFSDVAFAFVTVWNDGESGRALLDRYAIPRSAPEFVLPDLGPSSQAENRRRRFLDLPLAWIPATWIFHQGGQLAYAFNYGELRMETLRQAIEDTRRSWAPE